MAGLQSYTRKHLTTIMLVLLALGFALIVAELVLYRHFNGVQLVGFGATVLGLVLVVTSLFVKRGARNIIAVVMLVLSVAGLVGVIEHNEGDDEEGFGPPPAGATVPAAGDDDDAAALPAAPRPGEFPAGFGPRTPPPPLAPLGVSGLAVMAAIVMLARRDEPEPVVGPAAQPA